MLPNQQLYGRLLASGELDALSFAGAVGLLVSGVDDGPDLLGDPFHSWPDFKRVPYPLAATDDEEGDAFPVLRAIRYARSPWWPHVRAADLCAHGHGMADWINSADLSALTELDLFTWGDVGSVLAALRPERVPRLTALSLQWAHMDRVSGDDLEQFLSRWTAHKLRSLRISGNSPDVRRAVCRAVGDGLLPNLEALALTNARGLTDELLPLAGRAVKLELKEVSPSDVVALATHEALASQVAALTIISERGTNALLLPTAARFGNLTALGWSLGCYDRAAEAFLAALAAHGPLARLALSFATVGQDLVGGYEPVGGFGAKELSLHHAASFGLMLSDPARYDVPLARVLSFFAGANPTTLSLNQCVWGDASSESLVPLLAGTGLRDLELAGCDFGSVLSLAPAGSGRPLQRLDWSFNKGGWSALERLLAESGPGLRSLVIDNPQGDGPDTAMIVRSTSLSGLSRLWLRACRLRPDDARALAQHLPPDLLDRDLTDNPGLDEESVVALLRDSRLRSLLRLVLGGVAPKGRLLVFLASWPLAGQLVDLRLGNPLSSEPIDYPASLLNSPSLQFLAPPPPDWANCSNAAVGPLVRRPGGDGTDQLLGW